MGKQKGRVLSIEGKDSPFFFRHYWKKCADCDVRGFAARCVEGLELSVTGY
jgi:hypothetical protein